MHIYIVAGIGLVHEVFKCRDVISIENVYGCTPTWPDDRNGLVDYSTAKSLL